MERQNHPAVEFERCQGNGLNLQTFLKPSTWRRKAVEMKMSYKKTHSSYFRNTKLVLFQIGHFTRKRWNPSYIHPCNQQMNVVGAFVGNHRF